MTEKISPNDMPEVIKHAEEIRDQRGSFMINSVQIESTIGEIIARHFFPNDENNQDSFISLMIYDSGLSLITKIRLLLKIIKTHHQEIDPRYPNLENHLDDFREFRNIISHASIDYRTGDIKK